jgi:hypothetical protein
MSTPAAKTRKPPVGPDSVQPPSGPVALKPEAAGPASPPERAEGGSDAQWPSQCEDLTGITYRYRKGITEAWQRERIARALRTSRPQRAPPPEA